MPLWACYGFQEICDFFPKDKMVFMNHKFTGLVEEGIFAGRVFGFSLLQVRATATTSQALSARGEQICASCWQITQVWGRVMWARYQGKALTQLPAWRSKVPNNVEGCLVVWPAQSFINMLFHRIIVFGVGRDLKGHLVPTPAMSRNTFR